MKYTTTEAIKPSDLNEALSRLVPWLRDYGPIHQAPEFVADIAAVVIASREHRDLDTRLKIAFAEMRLADDKGAPNTMQQAKAFELYEAVLELSQRVANGERTPELLAEMRRVTEALSK